MLMVGVLTYHSFFFFFFFLWKTVPSFKVEWCSKKKCLRLEFWPIIQGTVMFQKKCPIIQGRVMFQKKKLMVGVLTHHSRYSDVPKKMLTVGVLTHHSRYSDVWVQGPSLKLHPHSIRHVIVNIDYHVSRFCLDSFLTKDGNIAMASFLFCLLKKCLQTDVIEIWILDIICTSKSVNKLSYNTFNLNF